MKTNYFKIKIHKADGAIHIVHSEDSLYAFENHRDLKFTNVKVPIKNRIHNTRNCKYSNI